MASKAIPTITAAGTLDGTEQVHIIQSSNSRRTTTQDIADLAAAGGDVSATGTPVALEYARWTDATTIEGRSTSEVLTDLGIEAGATADQSDAEIETAYNNQVAQVSQAEAEAGTVTSDRRWTPQRVSQAIAALAPAEIGIACSDETTVITTGTAKATFRMPYAMTVSAVRASLTTADNALLTVDINESGTSILSTKLTIDSAEKTSTTAATAAVISDSALADDAEITIDVDGAGTAGTGLKVWLIGVRA